jgi:hypothetical protein
VRVLALVGVLAATIAILVIAAAPERDRAQAVTPAFQPCEAGPRGGGYRIRVVRISCAEAQRAIPDMFDDKTVLLLDDRRSEDVYANDGGWSCLVQALPGGTTTQILCVRDDQVILYRFA